MSTNTPKPVCARLSDRTTSDNNFKASLKKIMHKPLPPPVETRAKVNSNVAMTVSEIKTNYVPDPAPAPVPVAKPVQEVEVPELIFVVPYRNRAQQKYFFSQYMSSTVLSHQSLKYEIYFSHQSDTRSFNRGATKNIGFLAVKAKYPKHYRSMTFVFHDIDTIPFTSLFDYKTSSGTVKHFYGFQYALGGIVSITGADFERINGYPNFWGWGMEDNVLQSRCENAGLVIDRSNFFAIGSPQILHLFDGVTRLINQNDPWRATHDDGSDGLRTIARLKYKIAGCNGSSNAADNVWVYHSESIYVINIETFETLQKYEETDVQKYDLREPPRKIIHPSRAAFENRGAVGPNESKKVKQAVVSSGNSADDWTNIPFYPTKDQRKDMERKFGKAGVEKIIEYNQLYSSEPNVMIVPPASKLLSHPPPLPKHAPEPVQAPAPVHTLTPAQIKAQHIIHILQQQLNRQQQQQQHQQHQQQQQRPQSQQSPLPPQQQSSNINSPLLVPVKRQRPNSASYLYSAAYAKERGVKERATTSARVGLGGVRF